MFGDKLVFSRGSFGDDGILLYDLSSDRLTQLTSDEAWDEYPRFSPDARKMAFDSTQNGKQEIRIMNVDGSGAKPI
jgi:Tol biopolymer transport system component